MYRASENTARQLGDDLQDNVFEALAVLGDGFIATNGLEVNDDRTITPESLHIDGPAAEAFTLDDLKEQALIYLYRLMFVFYAESRDLLQPETAANLRTYDEELSLIELRNKIVKLNDSPEEAAAMYLQQSTTQWQRLDIFFGIIDGGEENIGIQAYDGGLFDQDEHAFLNRHPVSNHHLAQVIFLLSTTEIDGAYETVDYDDLKTRHLGAVYEGLLEHRFNVATEDMVAITDDDEEVWEEAAEVDDETPIIDEVAAGGLYVATDDLERKVSGSYYTPKYIVDYVIHNTLDPRIETIHSTLDQEGFQRGTPGYVRAFRERILDLDVLDPAMGSGHFLTQATAYLARQVIELVREADELVAIEIGETDGGEGPSVASDGGATAEPDSPSEGSSAVSDASDHEPSAFEETQIRRDIAKECIYGVDKNRVAVELAKLSMWLETLAEDQPLAFLDHHLKHGDSLIGSDIEDIDGLNAGTADDQSTISRFTERRDDVIQMLMDVFADLFAIPNETIEDARAMKRIYYEQILGDPIYQRFKQIANVHTANEFGMDWARDSAFEHSGFPSDAFQYMADVLENDALWEGDPEEGSSVTSKSWFTTAQRRSTELSFFHWKLEFPEVFYDMDANERPDAGFDAVLGNPPWLGTRTGDIDSEVSDYLGREEGGFDAASGQYDLAAVFTEQAVGLASTSGAVGFVVPKRLATNEVFEGIRGLIANDHTLNYAVDLAVAFEGVNTDAMVLIVDSDPEADAMIVGEHEETRVETRPVEHDLLEAMPFTILPVNSTQSDIELVQTLNEQGTASFAADDIERGAEFGMNEACIYDQPNPSTWPVLDHRDVKRHLVSHSDQHIDLREADPGKLKEISIYDTVPKVLIRFLSDEIIAGRDELGYVSTNMVYHVQCEPHTDYLTGLLSSKLITFWYLHAFQSSEVKFPHVQQSHIETLPLVLPASDGPLEAIAVDNLVGSELSKIADSISTTTASATVEDVVDLVIEQKERRTALDVDITKYLDDEPEGQNLADTGLYQPTAADDSLLKTKKGDGYEMTKAKTWRLHVDRDGDTVRITATVRYKPDDPDVDGFVNTEPLPVFDLVEVPDLAATLIEGYVPMVGREGKGIAGFYQEPTTRNSLIDRIGNIRLPDVEANKSEITRYQRVKKRADELDESINRIESIINAIVYESYGLSDEEITSIEETVTDD